MKLLFKQYLASLNERDELDVVLPDILSEVGFTVISRPKRGTTQYGVDVAAIGKSDETGEKTLFLLSIKSGDLTRDEWATGKQALRPSLEEILEVYIPKHVPHRYKALPVTIALCFGGDIQEDVRVRVDSFIDKNSVPGEIAFEEWNGDHIASLIVTGLLREKIFPKTMQSSFRKAVALVDEPSVCIDHFTKLLHQLIDTPPKINTERLRAARQIYLATWTVFVWCRDTENLESAYRCSTFATLVMWHWCHSHFGKSKTAVAIAEVMQKMVSLNRLIDSAFLDEHVAPYSNVNDGLGVSVPSFSSVDINLKLFELLGRVALDGLWLIHLKAVNSEDTDKQFIEALNDQISKTSEMICNMIRNNPVFFTPLRDDHAIEITLTGLFLIHTDAHEFLANWIEQITLSSIFSHRSNGAYPCVFRDYADLASHPKPIEGYKKEATIGSILYPTLGVWLGIVQDQQTFSFLSEFRASDMKHSTWQLWIPDELTDEHIYTNTDIHGACLSELNLADGHEALLDRLLKEIKACTDFGNLSAIQFGLWPIVLMACHLYRLPVPPHFWTMSLLPRQDTLASSDKSPDENTDQTGQ